MQLTIVWNEHIFCFRKNKTKKVTLQGWMPVPEIRIYNKFAKIDNCGLSKRECYRILKTYFDVKKTVQWVDKTLKIWHNIIVRQLVTKCQQLFLFLKKCEKKYISIYTKNWERWFLSSLNSMKKTLKKF